MAKKIGLINPTQLWGKPLPSVGPTKAKDTKVTGKMTYDDDVTDDEDVDVDAELADAESEADADDDALEAVEAETDNEVTDDDADEPEEDDSDEEPDYDAEEGDVSDETEDGVEDGEEEVVTAVADDNDESGDDENAPETTGKGSMSEKMSLSDHVRAEITRRQKSGDSLRGVDIVETLAKKKIKVSPAQVSQLLKKAGVAGKPRGKKAATAVVAAGAADKSRVAHKAAKRDVEPAAPKAGQKAAAKARPATNGFKVPMTQLQAAEAFVDACGGSFSDAQRILTAAEQLSSTFGG